MVFKPAVTEVSLLSNLTLYEYFTHANVSIPIVFCPAVAGKYGKLHRFMFVTSHTVDYLSVQVEDGELMVSNYLTACNAYDFDYRYNPVVALTANKALQWYIDYPVAIYVFVRAWYDYVDE